MYANAIFVLALSMQIIPLRHSVCSHSKQSYTLCDTSNLGVDIYPLDGVDGDECYELVLHEARVCLSWTPGTQRFLAMIGDAKPHDVNYPMNKHKLDWRKEAEELYDKMGVKVFAIQECDISGEK